MSLDWSTVDLDEAKKAEVFPPDAAGLMNDALHVLIWLTIPVGIGHIANEADATEFWHRADIWQRSLGSGWVRHTDDGEEPILVTKEQVFAAVGLRTNCSPKTRSRFLKDVFATHERVG